MAVGIEEINRLTITAPEEWQAPSQVIAPRRPTTKLAAKVQELEPLTGLAPVVIFERFIPVYLFIRRQLRYPMAETFLSTVTKASAIA